jgi:hypothetical protein
MRDAICEYQGCRFSFSTSDVSKRPRTSLIERPSEYPRADDVDPRADLQPVPQSRRMKDADAKLLLSGTYRRNRPRRVCTTQPRSEVLLCAVDISALHRRGARIWETNQKMTNGGRPVG